MILKTKALPESSFIICFYNFTNKNRHATNRGHFSPQLGEQLYLIANYPCTKAVITLR